MLPPGERGVRSDSLREAEWINACGQSEPKNTSPKRPSRYSISMRISEKMRRRFGIDLLCHGTFLDPRRSREPLLSRALIASRISIEIPELFRNCSPRKSTTSGPASIPLSKSWAMGAALAHPLLDFGRIEASIDLKDAAKREAEKLYRQQLAKALRRVK